MMTTKPDKPWRDANVLRELYVNQDLSSREVAEKLDCDKKTVLTWLKRNGIDVTTPKSRRPPTFYTAPDGRERIKTQINGEQYSILHHRLLAVAEFGFDSVSDNIIHHLNGLAWDNRPSNIQLLNNQQEHMDKHREDILNRSDLSAEDIRKIREREGECSGYELADEYNISASSIYLIWKRESWGWVE